MCRYIFESKNGKQKDAEEEEKDSDGKRILRGKVIARLQVFVFLPLP